MVSSLHASVLGTTVPMGSVQGSASASSSNSTASSIGSASQYDSVSFSSTGQMMAAEGSHPPDFDSMDTEEFRAHLVELQETMAANGVDTSGFTDPSTMSEEDLTALKDEMSSMGSRGPKGKQGPPPPPPQSATTSTDEAEETDTLDLLLEMLQENDEEEEETSILSSLF